MLLPGQLGKERCSLLLPRSILDNSTNCRVSNTNVWTADIVIGILTWGRGKAKINFDSKSTVIYCLVTSRLNYGNILCVGLPLKGTQKCQAVLNAAARLPFWSSHLTHIVPISFRAFWLPACSWSQLKLLAQAQCQVVAGVGQCTSHPHSSPSGFLSSSLSSLDFFLPWLLLLSSLPGFWGPWDKALDCTHTTPSTCPWRYTGYSHWHGGFCSVRWTLEWGRGWSCPTTQLHPCPEPLFCTWLQLGISGYEKIIK